MQERGMSLSAPRLHIVIMFLCGIFLLLTPPAQAVLRLSAGDFVQINADGFGDTQNNYAWSMAWFKGYLYVGTDRNVACGEAASVDVFLPGFYVTNPAPGITCPPTPQDIDFRAEIWRYNPLTQEWRRVYRSPEVPIPSFPEKKVALDLGYRSMVVFREADGTQALYVGGVNSSDFNPGVPPARILRSTDGLTFKPLPQAPGTVLGSPITGFRSMVSYTPPSARSPRLYVIAGGSVGFGVVLEAQNPAGGNNNFRQISPASLAAYELAVFNQSLYIGSADYLVGYSVFKTNATGKPPYAMTRVVEPGTGRGTQVLSAVSMHVFKGRLYVGANGWFPPDFPVVAELIRINPDDTWELVVGNPRFTSQGLLFPISGLWDGFNNFWSAHFWRMEHYQDILYVGTNDSSYLWRGTLLEPFISNEFGADLWASRDGQQWTRITNNCFGRFTHFGIRTFANTPVGLFVGTTSQVTGTAIFFAPFPFSDSSQGEAP